MKIIEHFKIVLYSILDKFLSLKFYENNFGHKMGTFWSHRYFWHFLGDEKRSLFRQILCIF